MRVSRVVVLSAALLLLLAIHGCDGVRRGEDDEEPEEPTQQPEAVEDPNPPAQQQKEAAAQAKRSEPKEAAKPAGADSQYDPDEFTTTGETGSKASAGAAGSKKPSTTTQQTEDTLPPFFMEGCMVCIGIAFIINFFIGKAANEKIAHEWARTILADRSRAGITMNFALVGDNSERLDKVLIPDSYSHYMMHATGRRHCKSLLATLDLTKRHDLLAVAYNQVFSTPSAAADVIKFQVPLNDMGKFCVAICAKSEVRQLKMANSDIAKFTEPLTWKKLPKDIQLLTDCEEVMPEILRGEETLKALEKMKSYLRCIHISDKSEADPRYPAMLRCEFQLPKLTQEAGRKLATEMMQLAIHMIDVVARATDWQSRHAQVAVKVEQRRTERFNAKKKHMKMVETAQRRKDVKAAAEKEKMANMDPEELRRYEEKKYRQDMKKRMNAKTKVMR